MSVLSPIVKCPLTLDGIYDIPRSYRNLCVWPSWSLTILFIWLDEFCPIMIPALHSFTLFVTVRLGFRWLTAEWKHVWQVCSKQFSGGDRISHSGERQFPRGGNLLINQNFIKLHYNASKICLWDQPLNMAMTKFIRIAISLENNTQEEV